MENDRANKKNDTEKPQKKNFTRDVENNPKKQKPDKPKKQS